MCTPAHIFHALLCRKVCHCLYLFSLNNLSLFHLNFHKLYNNTVVIKNNKYLLNNEHRCSGLPNRQSKTNEGCWVITVYNQKINIDKEKPDEFTVCTIIITVWLHQSFWWELKHVVNFFFHFWRNYFLMSCGHWYIVLSTVHLYFSVISHNTSLPDI